MVAETWILRACLLAPRFQMPQHQQCVADHLPEGDIGLLGRGMVAAGRTDPEVRR